MQSDVIVTVCTSEYLQRARHLLRGDQAASDRRPVSFHSSDADLPAQDILLATRHGHLLGATLHQIGTGRVGWLWMPSLTSAGAMCDQRTGVASALVCSAVRSLASRGARLVQALLEPGHWGEGVLEGCGFRRIAEIVQMARGVDGECERAAGSDDLEFVSYSPALERQFVRVVEQTYTDSLDCPELDGLRPVEEVLQGYRAAGEFRSAHWWLVREGSEFVGCVLLGHFPESRSAVLQYMGVIPSRRRRGIGLRLVLQALQVASESRAERLTLAVDTRNIHAAQIYNKWGFAQTDRKSVFIVRV